MSEVRWFRHQREGIGVESWTYAMVALAGAEEVLQHGHDETSIDRQPTFNQWILIKDADGELDVVAVEAGGILVGSKATEIAAHIKKTWERGERAIAILRQYLADSHGQDAADEPVPLKSGGCKLLKVRSTMSDTVSLFYCFTASILILFHSI